MPHGSFRVLRGVQPQRSDRAHISVRSKGVLQLMLGGVAGASRQAFVIGFGKFHTSTGQDDCHIIGSKDVASLSAKAKAHEQRLLGFKVEGRQVVKDQTVTGALTSDVCWVLSADGELFSTFQLEQSPEGWRGCKICIDASRVTIEDTVIGKIALEQTHSAKLCMTRVAMKTGIRDAEIESLKIM